MSAASRGRREGNHTTAPQRRRVPAAGDENAGEPGPAASPAAAGTIAQMMEGAVTSCTGRRAAVPGVRIGGKTGTAENPAGPPHAWFVSFGPVEADPGTPQIALAVVVEVCPSVGHGSPWCQGEMQVFS